MFEFVIAIAAFFVIRHFFGGLLLPIVGTIIILFILGATVDLGQVRSDFQDFKKEVVE